MGRRPDGPRSLGRSTEAPRFTHFLATSFWTSRSRKLRRVAEGQQHALGLAVRLDAFRPVLAADARVLVATERRTGVERVHVDRVGAGPNLLGDLQRLR